jgi:uncharacterized protein
MKYLIVAVVVLIAVWWLRAKLSSDDRAGSSESGPRSASQDKPEAMLACRHCGVHVAASEAVNGRLGSYCGEVHRHAHEPD